MGILMSTTGSFSLDTFLTQATSVLTWFLSSLGSVLNFFTSNTALLLWFLVPIVGAAFVYFRKLL